MAQVEWAHGKINNYLIVGREGRPKLKKKQRPSVVPSGNR